MTPDERVAVYVRDQFRATHYGASLRGTPAYDDYTHLIACASTVAHVENKGDGLCGEGTCEMLYVDAEMRCDHGRAWEYLYREGGEMGQLIAALDKVSR